MLKKQPLPSAWGITTLVHVESSSHVCILPLRWYKSLQSDEQYWPVAVSGCISFTVPSNPTCYVVVCYALAVESWRVSVICDPKLKLNESKNSTIDRVTFNCIYSLLHCTFCCCYNALCTGVLFLFIYRWQLEEAEHYKSAHINPSRMFLHTWWEIALDEMKGNNTAIMHVSVCVLGERS